jgi:hypothetical protein
MASPVVGNRPPLAPLPVSLSIRHREDELAGGAGLLTCRADWARYRPSRQADWVAAEVRRRGGVFFRLPCGTVTPASG